MQHVPLVKDIIYKRVERLLIVFIPRENINLQFSSAHQINYTQ